MFFIVFWKNTIASFPRLSASPSSPPLLLFTPLYTGTRFLTYIRGSGQYTNDRILKFKTSLHTTFSNKNIVDHFKAMSGTLLSTDQTESISRLYHIVSISLPSTWAWWRENQKIITKSVVLLLRRYIDFFLNIWLFSTCWRGGKGE